MVEAHGSNLVVAFRSVEFTEELLKSIQAHAQLLLECEDAAVLMDLAIATGGFVITPTLGYSYKNLHTGDLGIAESYELSGDALILRPWRAARGRLCGRGDEILRFIRHTRDPEEREKLRRRFDGFSLEPLTALPDYEPWPTPTGFDVILDAGWASPYFVTEPDDMIARCDSPTVLVSTVPLLEASRPVDAGGEELFSGLYLPDNMPAIATSGDCVPTLWPVLAEAASRGQPIVLVAPDLGAAPLALLVVNKLRGTLKACAVNGKGLPGDALQRLRRDLRLTLLQSDGWLSGCLFIGGCAGFCSNVELSYFKTARY